VLYYCYLVPTYDNDGDGIERDYDWDQNNDGALDLTFGLAARNTDDGDTIPAFLDDDAQNAFMPVPLPEPAVPEPEPAEEEEIEPEIDQPAEESIDAAEQAPDELSNQQMLESENTEQSLAVESELGVAVPSSESSLEEGNPISIEMPEQTTPNVNTDETVEFVAEQMAAETPTDGSNQPIPEVGAAEATNSGGGVLGFGLLTIFLSAVLLRRKRNYAK